MKPHTHTLAPTHWQREIGFLSTIVVDIPFYLQTLDRHFQSRFYRLLTQPRFTLLPLSLYLSFCFILSPSVFMFGCFAHSKLLLCRVILSPFRPHLNIFLLLCMLLPFLLIFPLLFMMARHFLFFLCLFSSLFGLSLDYCVELFSVI